MRLRMPSEHATNIVRVFRGPTAAGGAARKQPAAGPKTLRSRELHVRIPIWEPVTGVIVSRSLSAHMESATRIRLSGGRAMWPANKMELALGSA